MSRPSDRQASSIHLPGKWTFVLVPRCASSAIKHALYQRYYADGAHGVDGIPDAPKVYTMWRHPYDRLFSAWAYLFSRPQYLSQCGFPTDYPTWPDFIEGVAALPDSQRNLHFRSQHGLCTVDGEFKPTNIFLWDFLTLERDFDLHLPRHQPTPSPKLRFAVQYADYAEDLRIWQLGLSQSWLQPSPTGSSETTSLPAPKNSSA